MTPLQQSIDAYQSTMVKLSGELGVEAQQEALRSSELLLKNPYLSSPLKLTLQKKVNDLLAHSANSEERKDDGDSSKL